MKTNLQFPGATGLSLLGVILLLSCSAEAFEGRELSSMDHQEDQPQTRSQGFRKSKDVSNFPSKQDLREDLEQMADDVDSNDADEAFEARIEVKRNFIPSGYIPVRGRRKDLEGSSHPISYS